MVVPTLAGVLLEHQFVRDGSGVVARIHHWWVMHAMTIKTTK